jgi:uncharacterized membrane protein (UPF0127 family)
MNKKLLLIIGFTVPTAIIALIFIYSSVNKQFLNMPIAPVLRQLGARESKQTIKINNVEIAVDVARTAEEKANGLSGRKGLGKNEGMLFVFNNKTQPSFWMKDMNFAIDIIWIAESKIIGIEKSVPPPEKNVSTSELPLYKPSAGIDYVLEVNAEYSTNNNFEIGDYVELTDIN